MVMGNLSLRAIICFFIIVDLAITGDALQCYQCNDGQKSNKCKDAKSKDCDSEHNFCRKATYTISVPKSDKELEGEQRLWEVKSCAKERTPKDESKECQKRGGPNPKIVTQTVCECKTNSCNSAPGGVAGGAGAGLAAALLGHLARLLLETY